VCIQYNIRIGKYDKKNNKKKKIKKKEERGKIKGKLKLKRVKYTNLACHGGGEWGKYGFRTDICMYIQYVQIDPDVMSTFVQPIIKSVMLSAVQ
jgi:hypothetical protein